MLVRNIFTLIMSLLLVSCASTKVTESWLDSNLQKSYKHLLIIGVSDSQQTRQIYEKHFVSELAKNNINATPSYTLISSKQEINRETVVNAIKGGDIDAVLVTYLVSSDSVLTYADSPINPGYSSDTDNMMSDTLISSGIRSDTTEVIGLKNDLYDVASQSIVWSLQTETVAPDSIDKVVIDVVDLMISQMFDDGLLK